MKKVYLGIIFLFGFIFGINDAAAQTNYSAHYHISNYNVDMVVHDDNSYDITETITAELYNKHGIIRQIPVINKVVRQDGTKETNRAQITNVLVKSNSKYSHEPYTISKDSANVNIKIGDASKTISGTKEYVISYTYNLGKDFTKKYDELYFNLVGTQWDTYIKNVSFKITMPKEFDSSKLGFSAGSYGAIGTNDIYYNVSGNIITGKYTHGLNAYQGLNVRLELPEGYYMNAKHLVDIDLLITFIIPLIFVLIAFIMWLFVGRDGRKIETVEFTPPENLNSVELGYIYKGKTSNADILSLIVYFANKGYLKIEQFSINDFRLTKLKEYDGNNYIEKTFFKELFDLGITVTKDNIEAHFNTTLDKIKTYLETKVEKDIYHKNSTNKKGIIITMVIITCILLGLQLFGGLSSLDIENVDNIMIFLIPLAIFLPVILINRSTVYQKMILLIILGIIFVPLVVSIKPVIYFDVYFIFYLIWCIICIGLLGLFIHIMPRKTEKGLQLYGRIEGFKNFLKTAVKEELEVQVQKNPNYFYEVLPYTYVLGISDKWIKQFNEINIEPPIWYNGSESFNMHSFNNFIDSAVHTSIYVPAPVYSSSGSSSDSFGGGSSSSGGGGSSGGGSGGGGGSSW